MICLAPDLTEAVERSFVTRGCGDGIDVRQLVSLHDTYLSGDRFASLSVFRNMVSRVTETNSTGLFVCVCLFVSAVSAKVLDVVPEANECTLGR